MKKKARPGDRTLQPDLFEEDTVSSSSGERTTAVMHCDGASSGNPGDSGIGAVIYPADKNFKIREGNEPVRVSNYIGSATNNIAEYTALIRGLRKAQQMAIKRIRIFLDSELLVRQITGVYKVRNRNLMPLWTEATTLLKQFDEWSINHIPREYNREADALARQGIRKKSII